MLALLARFASRKNVSVVTEIRALREKARFYNGQAVIIVSAFSDGKTYVRFPGQTRTFAVASKYLK